jgi:cell fate regulator YaaT (PSP1 superfamily)
MYIIYTIGNRQVKADFDELVRIAESTDNIVFLRQGAVNPKHITTIEQDTERMSEVVRRPGESEESVQQRIQEEKSDDIFSSLRSRGISISGPAPKKLL